MGGLCVCDAVSQHISNDLSDMMWWKRKKALNSNGCVKCGLCIFSVHSIPLQFTSYFKLRQKTEHKAFKVQLDNDVSGHVNSHKWMIQHDYTWECLKNKGR